MKIKILKNIKPSIARRTLPHIHTLFLSLVSLFIYPLPHTQSLHRSSSRRYLSIFKSLSISSSKYYYYTQKRCSILQKNGVLNSIFSFHVTLHRFGFWICSTKASSYRVRRRLHTAFWWPESDCSQRRKICPVNARWKNRFVFLLVLFLWVLVFLKFIYLIVYVIILKSCYTGSGFVSNDIYLHGFFSSSIKLPSDYSAGVVIAFYVSNNL